jgi:2-polyprenyl-6-methoxyphenol hydroxylase-like FAD-dependent oxidoreductase
VGLNPGLTDSYEVVVVGGGPVGMWLAAELRRAGIGVVVLEKRARRPPQSKALTVYPRTIEMFDMRGQADRFLTEGGRVPSSHFAILGNRLDFSFLDTRYPFTLFLPQRRTEELLNDHLDELGVPVLRSHEVTGLRQSASGVQVDASTPSGPATFTSAYVVGCDGAGSAVRQAAGIEFTGTPSNWHTILGDIELADPPAGRAATMCVPGGSLYIVGLGGDRWRLATIDHATMFDPPAGPVTFAELRASALRLAGTDFGMRETPDAWLSRVGNETRQAATYRHGRVLLAGDAAHVHFPAGGQGLNLGLQDASNLAWKLAAELRGWAPPWLLDSYESERVPVGLDVIDDSLAQCGLFASPGREGVALRDRFDRILGENEALCRSLAVRLSGLAITYPASSVSDPAARGGTPLAGRRVPDLTLRGAPAPSIYGLLHQAKFVLLTTPRQAGQAGQPGQPQAADHLRYQDRCAVVTAELADDRPGWPDISAMLIRPDGYLAWVLPESEPQEDPPLSAWLCN